MESRFMRPEVLHPSTGRARCEAPLPKALLLLAGGGDCEGGPPRVASSVQRHIPSARESCRSAKSLTLCHVEYASAAKAAATRFEPVPIECDMFSFTAMSTFAAEVGEGGSVAPSAARTLPCRRHRPPPRPAARRPLLFLGPALQSPAVPQAEPFRSPPCRILRRAAEAVRRAAPVEPSSQQFLRGP